MQYKSNRHEFKAMKVAKPDSPEPREREVVSSNLKGTQFNATHSFKIYRIQGVLNNY